MVFSLFRKEKELPYLFIFYFIFFLQRDRVEKGGGGEKKKKLKDCDQCHDKHSMTKKGKKVGNKRKQSVHKF